MTSAPGNRGTAPDEALADVIDRTALVENLLNQLIEAYLQPRKEAQSFLWDVVMDSSILSLGAKVKTAGAIAQLLSGKLDGNALHGVVSLRNAFAHHATNAHPMVFVSRDPGKDELHYMLQVISNSGRLTRKSRTEALAEFNVHYEAAKASLIDLLAKIRSALPVAR
jgi:hypothetical protein